MAFTQFLLTSAERPFRQLALGYICGQPHHSDTFAGIAVERLAADSYPADSPIVPDDTIFIFVFDLFLDRLFHRFHGSGQIIRVYSPGPGFVALLNAEGLQAKVCKMLFGPLGLVSLRVPIPNSHLPRLEREPQSFFTIAQCLLSAFT